MANIIKPKRSSVPAHSPGATDLEIGEIALNLTDGILYTKDTLGQVKEVGRSVDLSTALPVVGGTITGDLTVNNSFTSQGPAQLNGTVRLGSTTSNTITVNGNTLFNGSTSGINYNDLSNKPAATDLSNYSTTAETSLAIDAKIAAIDTTDWDTAHSWGDHSVAGYLVAADITDLATETYVENRLLTKTTEGYVNAQIAAIDTTDWDTAHSWGDHSTMGYGLAADIPDVSGFALAADIPDVSGFALTTDIPDVSGYATTTQLSNKLPKLNGTATNLTLEGSITEHYKSQTNIQGTFQPNADDGSIQQFQLTGSPSFSGITGDIGTAITFILKQDTTGNRTWSNFGNITCYYAGGNKALSPAPSARDVVSILKTGNTTYYISIANGFST